jgi:hypothetical protein
LFYEPVLDKTPGMRAPLTYRLCSLGTIAALAIGALGARAGNEGAEKTKRPVSARIEAMHKVGIGDPIGNVIVKYADGTEDQWTVKGNCSNPKVSPSGVVGWIVYSLSKDGESIKLYGDLPVNGKISICEKGNVLATVSTTKAFIEQWGFAADGRHFVAKSRGAHGPASIQLFAFKNGPAEAAVEAYSEDLPDWARSYKDD